jgi:hypothetical protein
MNNETSAEAQDVLVVVLSIAKERDQVVGLYGAQGEAAFGAESQIEPAAHIRCKYHGRASRGSAPANQAASGMSTPGKNLAEGHQQSRRHAR